jgi:hypothetical protein
MNITMWEYRTFESKIFVSGKFYYSDCIVITNFIQTLIPNRWLEDVFPTYFGIEQIQIMKNQIFRYSSECLLYLNSYPI